MTSDSANKQVRLFDEWAATYDRSIQSCKGFPFTGYDEVLATVTRQCEATKDMSILDLGIGTGRLAQGFQKQGCLIWGLDFSSEMLAVAREQLPEARLFHADMQAGWPQALCRKFDRIVSGYALHHLDLSSKTALLWKLCSHHLVTGGKVVIGDIAFETSGLRSAAHERWHSRWDPSEHYWAADETRAACERIPLLIEYTQVSSCGGVFAFRFVGESGEVQ